MSESNNHTDRLNCPPLPRKDGFLKSQPSDLKAEIRQGQEEEQNDHFQGQDLNQWPEGDPDQLLVGSHQENRVEDALSIFEVSQDYADGLGKEKFLYPDLIISQHILTVIAMSGGGKTTFMYTEVVPKLTEQGLKVWYIDADSPASEHKRMKTMANKYNFKFLNPDVNNDTSAHLLLLKLNELADGQANLDNHVFFFDTLKKFTSLMNKNSVKEFFVLARKLATRGATVVSLGHANKYRDSDGNLIFEGVNDVKSDSDELIFLEKISAENGGINVTTIVDPDKGAKTRGLFRPFSFNISKERTVTVLDKPINLKEDTSAKATDYQILQAAREYIADSNEPVSQKLLIDFVSGATGAGINRTRKLIMSNAAKKGTDRTSWKTFSYSVGGNNVHLFELTGNR